MRKIMRIFTTMAVFIFLLASFQANAADRENFSVGNLDVQSQLSIVAKPTVKYLGHGVNWTLTNAESKTTVLVLSSGDGTPSIIAPLTAGKFYVVTIESGTVAVTSATIRGSSGAGVSIAVGKTAIVRCDGTKYVRVTADATSH